MSDGANKGPGLVRKAGNFGKAVVKHVADGGGKVSDDVYFARLVICAHCDALDPEKVACTHLKCGCRLLIKARWRTSRCPLQKWPE